VVGKFRTGNKRKNLLTRCINIEGMCFQSVVQAGRHFLYGVAALTGTNYVIRRSILELIEGWDEEALAEDSEMSARLYMYGHKVDFVPYSVSWEQEPETFAVWLKQRTRWARGNNYAIMKLVKMFRHAPYKWYGIENIVVLLSSYCFLLAIVIAQLSMLMGLLGIAYTVINQEWLFYFWKIAFLIYVVQLSIVLSFDAENIPENILVGMVMYFSYCYMWTLAIIRALYLDFIRREKRTWDKTVRFNTELETRNRAVVGIGD